MHSALVSAQLIIFRVPRSRLRGIYFEWRGILQLSPLTICDHGNRVRLELSPDSLHSVMCLLLFTVSPVTGAPMDDEYNLQDHSDLYILDLGKWRSKHI